VAASVLVESGTPGQAAAPSRAATDSSEAFELRDGDAARYGGATRSLSFDAPELPLA